MFDQEFLDKVPQEMKEASARLRAAVLRERKARTNAEGWKKELAIAASSLSAEELNYGAISLRWNPDTQTMTPLPDEAPKVT